MTLPPRIIITQRPPPVPHKFERSTAAVRRFGAPMSNPPQPSDLMPNPYCSVCNRLRKDPIHTDDDPQVSGS